MKLVCYEIKIDGKVVIIGGIVKGLGMIYLNMVMMFSFIIMDVKVEVLVL